MLLYIGDVQSGVQQVGVAEARRRFRELLDLVDGGETVQVTRRDTVVALIVPPTPATPLLSLSAALDAWREDWAVATWPDEDLFDDVRDRSPDRAPPW